MASTISSASSVKGSGRTKSEFVYDYLKQKIIDMEYKPDEKLIIRQVAMMLGVSDIPVREALGRLESDGLVTSVPHAGYRLCSLNDKSVIEKLVIKADLEILAMSAAVDNVPISAFPEIGAMIEELKKAEEEAKFLLCYKFIRAFSLRIYTYCRNEELYKLLETLFYETSAVSGIYERVPEWDRFSVSTYVAIWESIKRRDKSAAVAMLNDIKQRIIAQVRETLRENP
jgi:DNA-binding GntR family transcriptional regulator